MANKSDPIINTSLSKPQESLKITAQPPGQESSASAQTSAAQTKKKFLFMLKRVRRFKTVKTRRKPVADNGAASKARRDLLKQLKWRFSYGDDQILFNYGWFEHDRILCLGLDPAVSADLFGKSKAQEGTGRPKIALLGGVEEPVWLQAWLQLESTKQLFAHIKSREPPVIRGNGAPESDLPGPGSEHRKSGVGLSAKSKAQKEGATPAKKALKSLRRGWLRGWLEEIQERSTKEPVADKDPHEPPVTRGNGGPGSGLSGPSSKHSELGVWPADRRAHARNPKVRNAGSSYKQKLALRGEMDKNPNQSSHFPVALADLQEAEVQEGAEHIVAATEVKTSGGKQSLSAVADKSADLPETIFFTALKEFQSIYADLPNDTRRILALSKGVKLDPQLRRILTDLETDL